jgi:hypothetical protein
VSDIVFQNAVFSECRNYRYTLWRTWQPLLNGGVANFVNFIMLNPSTADEIANDRTISKCIKFSKSWGFDGLCVTNLFAYRTKDPKLLKQIADPIGLDNNHHILETAQSAAMVIAAWSQHGTFKARSWSVQLLIRGTPLHYLRIGKTGEPYHPLYLPDNTKPKFWY